MIQYVYLKGKFGREIFYKWSDVYNDNATSCQIPGCRILAWSRKLERLVLLCEDDQPHNQGITETACCEM